LSFLFLITLALLFTTIGPITLEASPTDTRANLIVITKVIGGGPGDILRPASDFTILVSGNNANPLASRGNESGTTVTLGSGEYSLEVINPPAGYYQQYSGDCRGTINFANETKTCTITNTFVNNIELTSTIRVTINITPRLEAGDAFLMEVRGAPANPSIFGIVTGSTGTTTISVVGGNNYEIVETAVPPQIAPYTNTTYSDGCRGTIGFQQTKECVIENSIPAPIPVDFDMLSFGDSVMWGTGLLHHQKFRTLVEDQIKARYPSIPATANAYTHTAAIIGSSFYNIFRWDEVPGQDTQKLKDFLQRRFPLDWTNANASKDGETAINIGPACNLGTSRCNTAKISLNPDGDSANINIFGGLLQRNPLFVSKFVDGERTMSLSPDYYKLYHGEIPRGYPTILQMVDGYKGPIEPKRVDLILLDGCITDVGATSRLLDDQIPHSNLESVIYQSCHDGMKTLLQAVSSKFPNAVIIVTGYFIAVSQQTIDNGGGDLISLLVFDPLVPDTWQTNFDIIVSHWDLWNRDHKSYIRQAIQEVDPSGRRVFFADPLFGPDNAVLGENALLFGNGPPLFLPLDPASEERGEACNRELPSSASMRDEIACKYASMAHPTPEGAKKYAGEIMRILDSGVLSNIMTHLDQPKVPPG
jgi:hypothetical protein